MNVCVIGGGAREHALCVKIKESSHLGKLFTIGNNPAFKEISINFELNPNDFESVLKLCKENNIELVVVGPEDPLSKGIADYLLANGIKVFGPKLKGAVLESSKQVAKEFMYRNYIPTAEFKIFYDSTYAKEYIYGLNKFPVVIKADGLCAGKGVRICSNIDEAIKTVEDFMEKRVFGTSSMKIVIEEFIKGKECSVLCFVDGKRYLMLPLARDHKRLNDGDTGPNTGGMGAISPLNLSSEVMRQIEEDIVWRFMEAIIREKIDYRGVIYFGLMVGVDGPKVLEFNVRFGDPETQAIIPLIDEDILKIFNEVASGNLSLTSIKIKKLNSVCVVLASKGYPENPIKGDEISGLDRVDKDVSVFFAGVSFKDEKYYTNGGRVLSVVTAQKTMEEARNKVYDNITRISFKDMHYRKDIGLNL